MQKGDVGVKLVKTNDGTFYAGLVDRNENLLSRKGPMSRQEAETFMRKLYTETGAGAETAAYHGIEVRA